MIFVVVDFLRDSFGLRIPAVFEYCSTRMILAAITSLLLSVLLGPRFIKKLYELKIGQSIRMEECPLLGELHKKKKDTPTMGGMLILASMIVSLVLWMDWNSIFTLILLITTLWLGGMGAYDDFLKLKYKNTKGLSAKKKLLLQILLSGGLSLYLLCPMVSEAFHFKETFIPPIAKEQMSTSVTLTDMKEGETPFQEISITTLSLREMISTFYIPFVKSTLFTVTGVFTLLIPLWIIFVVTGSSNAVNLTDGLDGLAAGLLVMTASAMAIIAFLSNHIDIAHYLNILYIEGSGEIAVYLAALVGACLGFLWYNGYPAQVFMGDTGSLALGGILGVVAILLRKEFLLAIIGGLFVAETLSVILQVGSYKLRNKKRIFLCSPLHHHFEYKGWPETKVVIRFWIIGLLLAIIGLASLKFQ